MTRVAIVGGGISGMSAAFRLRQAGYDVLVLEADDEVGGRTRATRRDGFVLNRGASLVPGSYRAWLSLVRDAGLGAHLRRLHGPIGVVRDGTVHEVRGEGLGAVMDAIRTPLLSSRSKVRALNAVRDGWRMRSLLTYADHQARAEHDTETIEDYCLRRLNREILDRVIDPVLGGLFLVDVGSMSVVDLFLTLGKVMQGGLWSYPGGADFVSRAIAGQLPVRTSAFVTSVEESADHVDVAWEENGARRSERFDACVITVPAPLVSRMYPQLPAPLADILNGGLSQANFVGVRFALSRRPPTDAVAVCVPQHELDGLGTLLYEHNIAYDSAPPGRGIIGAYAYHDWADPRLKLTDDELVAEMLPAVDKIVPGIAEMTEFVDVTRWTPGALMSKPGMHSMIAQLDAGFADLRRVQLAGDYLNIPGMNGCVVGGTTAARRISEKVSV